MTHNCQDKLDKGEEGVNYQDGGSGGHQTGRGQISKCELWPPVALFDMPNLNRFVFLSISIFCKIALSISISISILSKITISISISISIFSKITLSISISISIFLELPYRYRYFSELPYRYRYFQLLHIDIDININIFQKCRYIDNRYFISIF